MTNQPAKMILLFLLLLIVVNTSFTSNNGLNDELHFLHREIGVLREENQNQNQEISMLKGMVGFQENGTIQDQIIGFITKELDKQKTKEQKVMVHSNHRYQHSSGKARLKRPYRLIPTHNERNKDDGVINRPETRRFYGPPTNCSELSQLGHTLNGFYQVKSIDTHNSKALLNLDTVYCAFKQPEGTMKLSDVLEKRIEKGNRPVDGSVSSVSGIHFHVESRGRSVYDLYEKDKFGIQFEKLYLNLGNAFDLKMGIFTATKTGVYRFFFTAEIGSTLGPHSIEFYHGTKMFTSTSVQNLVRPLIEANIKLNKGDYIYLKVNRGDSRFAIGRMSFSGSLLTELVN